MITGVTSHVLQVDGAAHVISDDRRDVRLLTGVKRVIRRRQPSAAGRVVVAVTVVAVRRPGRDLSSSDRPGRKRPTMPERGGDQGRAEENASQRGAPRLRKITPAMARKITAVPLPANANTELPASHMAKVWPR